MKLTTIYKTHRNPISVASDTDSDCLQLDDLYNRLKPKIRQMRANPSEADVAKISSLLAKFLQLAQKCGHLQYEGRAHLWACHFWSIPISDRKANAYKAVEVLRNQENLSLYADSLYNLAFMRKEILKVDEGDDCKLLKEAMRIYRAVDRTWSDHDKSKEIKSLLNHWDC